MSEYAWESINPEKLKGGKEGLFILENAPPILHSRMDKEYTLNSVIILLFMVGLYLIYAAIQYVIGLSESGFGFVVFIIVSVVVIVAAIPLIIQSLRSRSYNKLIKSYYEVYIAHSDNKDEVYYCMVYYPTFLGKTHPIKAYNLIYEIYLQAVFSKLIDVTQIEVYYKGSKTSQNILKSLTNIGYFFKYGEGQEFYNEKSNRNTWKLFDGNKSENENYISVANWDHLYEWRDDLVLDYDKLHELAPWVVNRWNNLNMVPLTQKHKDKLRFNKRNLGLSPKLKPWLGTLDQQTYSNELENTDLNLIQQAINDILGAEFSITNTKLIKQNIFKFREYFKEHA